LVSWDDSSFFWPACSNGIHGLRKVILGKKYTIADNGAVQTGAAVNETARAAIVKTLEHRHPMFKAGFARQPDLMGCVLPVKSTAGRFAAPAVTLVSAVRTVFMSVSSAPFSGAAAGA
jgi:hypothetical protein